MNKLLVKRGSVKDKSIDYSDKVYIGRANKTYDLRQHVLANPFVIGKDGNRDTVVQKYRGWLYEQIVEGRSGKNNPVWNNLCHLLMTLKVREKPLTLTCWCKENEKCHGDVVISCLNWMNDNNLGE